MTYRIRFEFITMTLVAFRKMERKRINEYKNDNARKKTVFDCNIREL